MKEEEYGSMGMRGGGEYGNRRRRGMRGGGEYGNERRR